MMTPAQLSQHVADLVNYLHRNGHDIPPFVLAVGDGQFQRLAFGGNIRRPLDRLRILNASMREVAMSVVNDEAPVEMLEMAIGELVERNIPAEMHGGVVSPRLTYQGKLPAPKKPKKAKRSK